MVLTHCHLDIFVKQLHRQPLDSLYLPIHLSMWNNFSTTGWFFGKLYIEGFIEICQNIAVLFKIGQNQLTLYLKTRVYLIVLVSIVVGVTLIAVVTSFPTVTVPCDYLWSHSCYELWLGCSRSFSALWCTNVPIITVHCG